ncbi:phage major capsid protein [Propionivibrio sp.]|uniref:phage major capsid protein n=1 Tax=Propionivibrio sp. TaxID=2212460 RepID=UPI0039E2CEDC
MASNLQELRQYRDDHSIEILAELSKNGLSLEVDDKNRSKLVAYRNDLRRVINGHRDKALAIADAKGPIDPKAKARYDESVKAIEMLGVLVDLTDHKINLLDIGEEHAAIFGLPSASWKNNGQAVRPLARNDRFADTISGRHEQNIGFGEYVKAMVAGTNRQEIRDALVEGTDSAGGYTVPRVLMAQLIDAMRAKTVAIQAGAITVPLETEKTTIARLDSDPQAGWRLELGAVAESSPTFGAVTFIARSLACMVKISRELLEDSLNIDTALMTAFAGAMAGELDRVALFGSGEAPEPRGLCNTAGILGVSMGENGAAITNYAPMLDALFEVENANASAPTAWVMAPRTSRVLNGLTDSTGQPLNAPEAVSRIPRLVTTQVPINQSQGTAHNASSVILGDFSQLLIGVRTQLRIEVLRELFSSTMEYAFLAHLRADIAVAQPKAFAVIRGVKP